MGALGVESRMGKRSRFIIRLAAAEAAPEQAA